MATLLFKWLLLFTIPFSTRAGQLVEKAMHPFYVSVVEIHHNNTDKTLEVSCRIFIDDMENVLKQNYKTPVNLSHAQPQNDKFINDYILKHLGLTADGKKLNMTYVGYEKDAESVFCYFEVPQVASVKNLKISNSLLHDLTTDQINIMHVTVNGNRKSFKLDYPKTEASFSF